MLIWLLCFFILWFDFDVCYGTMVVVVKIEVGVCREESAWNFWLIVLGRACGQQINKGCVLLLQRRISSQASLEILNIN